MIPDISKQIETAVFEKVKIAVQQRLSLDAPFVANHLTMGSHLDHWVNNLVLQLTSFVLAKKTETIDIEEKWPADWWQAVRERWAPNWWLKRWPVKYKTISIHRNCYRTCPHLPIKTPDGQQHVHFQWLSEGRE